VSLYLAETVAGWDPWSGIFVHSVALLGGALSMLPGGVGGAEVALTLLLDRMGLTLTDAVVAAVLIRLVTFWYAIVLGAVVWFLSETAFLRISRKTPGR